MNVFKEAVLSLKKNKLITFTTIGVLTFNMLILSIFLFVFINLNLFLEEMKENVSAVLFLKDNMPKEDVDNLMARIGSKAGIENYVFVSKSDALKEFEENAELKSFIDTMKVNPLPDSIKIKINSKYKDVQKLNGIVGFLRTLEGVTDVSYPQKEVEKLLEFINMVKSIMLVLSLILIISSVLIVSSTIRITIFARKEDIKFMRTSGAANLFINGIFIIEGILEGVIGGILAIILLFVLQRIVHDKLDILWSGRWQYMDLKLALLIIAIGFVLGAFSSLFIKIKKYSE